VLSNAPILEGICEDRLPELPREASLIASASRADVVGLLQQQAGGVGPDVAVRLTAGTLADSRSLDPSACVWVVSEFARCLGYTVSDAIAPAGVGAAGGPPPAAAAPAPPAPPAQPGPVTPAMDAPTMVPPAAPVPAPMPVPGQPPAQVPAAAMPMPPPPVQAAAGFNQPVTQGPGPAGWGGQAPTGWGGQAGGGGFPPPPSPPRPSKGRGPLLASVGVAAVAVLYLIVAGVASLPPFGGKASPQPSGSASASASASVSSSPSQPPAGTPGQTLRNLIPGSFQAKGECVNKKTGWPGQTAEITCTGAPNVPGDYVTYYLFGSTSALNKAYAGFLSQYAKTTQGAGSCDSFKAFRSCETIYGPSAKNSNVGHIVEYKYKGTPDISYTVSKDLLIIDTAGADGNGMVTWWAGLPPPWLSASGWATASS
jgi:hypothetical protein